MHRATDRQVPVQQVEFIQNPQPVMLAAAHERQVLRPRITDVARDVPAVLSRPPERYRGGVPVALHGEVAGERERDDQLEEGAAEDVHEFPEGREDEVTGLVYGEVDVVDEAEVPRMGGEEPAVDGQASVSARREVPAIALRSLVTHHPQRPEQQLLVGGHRMGSSAENRIDAQPVQVRRLALVEQQRVLQVPASRPSM